MATANATAESEMYTPQNMRMEGKLGLHVAKATLGKKKAIRTIFPFFSFFFQSSCEN